MTRAVVCGYGEVGIRCLAAVLARDIDVPLVITHAADPDESQWYGSLERYAREHDIEVLIGELATADELHERVKTLAPEFLFSFYYRRMLPPSLLTVPSRGALNLHGSLLPKFRGRAPINWAILKGERETGVTLHYMTAKPDAGDIVAQRAFPIFPDDIALDVFRNVCAAAEATLYETLPLLIAGTAPRIVQNLASGSYFTGRKSEDGRIDWQQSALEIHNLVRAVAPPYPGAFTHWSGRPARVLRTRFAPDIAARFAEPTAFAIGDRCYAQCGDRRAVRLLEVEVEGAIVPSPALAHQLTIEPLRLSARTAA